MNQKTQAILFEGREQVALREIELPEPQDDELIVKMTASGVSVGTERWALLDQRPEMKYPYVTGYLGVGKVEWAGPKVEDFQVGDRIFTTDARHIEPFQGNSWLATHCARAVVPTVCGGEWPPYVCKIPDAVSDAAAAMAGLAAVSVQGADMLRVSAKDVAVVLGLGLIGQSSVQVLRAKGARVIAADLLPMRVEKALETGCDAAITLDKRPLSEQLAPYLPADGADIVVDTTAAPPVVLQLASLLRRRGQILLQGYYPGHTIFDVASLHAKRPTLYVACSSDVESHRYAHRLLESGLMKLDSLVTHQVAAQKAPEIYRMVLEQPDEFLGIVFHWEEA